MLEKVRTLRISERLPVFGIVAFSACSVNSLANLFLGSAEHPTPMLWVASALVELTTAWVVYQVVENVRKVTKSNVSKQDRKFYSLVLGAFVWLALPPLGLSVYANALEFGSFWMGLVFPLLSVACAVGYAMPDAVNRFEKRKEVDKAETERKRAERQAERDRKAAERDRKEAEKQAERERKQLETLRKAVENERQLLESQLSGLGNAAETLRFYQERPQATQAEAAETLQTSERTIRNHLSRLESAGLIKRNGSGVEVVA